jgi:hypothetical protein
MAAAGGLKLGLGLGSGRDSFSHRDSLEIIYGGLCVQAIECSIDVGRTGQYDCDIFTTCCTHVFYYQLGRTNQIRSYCYCTRRVKVLKIGLRCFMKFKQVS